jgi:hypothetical protein
MLTLGLINFAPPDGTAAGVLGILIALLLVVGGVVVYFLPTLIAVCRNHHQWGAITVINLFFGWTFIGWVLTLAWSVSAAREK